MNPSHKESLSRRHFLRTSAGIAAGAALGNIPLQSWAQAEALGEEDATAPTPAKPNQPSLNVLMQEADGKALERARLLTLHARDMANDPLPQAITREPRRTGMPRQGVAPGAATLRIELADEPMQLSGRLLVPGFGEVYCYADNNGRGYTRPGTIEFVVDAAATRLNRVRQAWEASRRLGVLANPEVERHLTAAARPIPAAPALARIGAAYEALSHGLHAGEMIALNMARHRIARLPQPRRDFRFGCLMAGYNRFGPDYNKHLKAAFNYATISWYTWQNEQPVEQRINYTRMDDSLNWCLANGIEPKGFGYVYLARGATPEWLRSWPYEKILPEYQRVVTQTLERYRDRLHTVEVINETHDKANLWRLSHAQILELTRTACHAARVGSPTVQRQINHCCMWAEYAKRRNTDGSRRWSPYGYLRDCVNAGVEWEVTGLQLYYPQMDLLEIERMLDRFKDFKRPLHITEMATASQDGLDPNSMRPKTLNPGWHGPWNETMQADWLEAIYTLCYSKPEFAAINWWDLADVGGHFWPYGGLLHKDLTPKESYLRLQKLQRDWGVSRQLSAI